VALHHERILGEARSFVRSETASGVKWHTMRKSIFRGRRPLCFLEVATVRSLPSPHFSLPFSLSLSSSVSLIPRACFPPPAIASPEPIGDESVTRLRDATNERRRARWPFQASSCFSRVPHREFRASPRFCSPFAYPSRPLRADRSVERFRKRINPFNRLPASTFRRFAELGCHLSERGRRRDSILVSRLHISHALRINPHRTLLKSRVDLRRVVQQRGRETEERRWETGI